MEGSLDHDAYEHEMWARSIEQKQAAHEAYHVMVADELFEAYNAIIAHEKQEEAWKNAERNLYDRVGRLRSFYEEWDESPRISTMPRHYQDMMTLRIKKTKDQSMEAGAPPRTVINALFYLPVYLLRVGVLPHNVKRIMTMVDVTIDNKPIYDTNWLLSNEGKAYIKDIDDLILKEQNGALSWFKTRH